MQKRQCNVNIWWNHEWSIICFIIIKPISRTPCLHKNLFSATTQRGRIQNKMKTSSWQTANTRFLNQLINAYIKYGLPVVCIFIYIYIYACTVIMNLELYNLYSAYKQDKMRRAGYTHVHTHFTIVSPINTQNKQQAKGSLALEAKNYTWL